MRIILSLLVLTSFTFAQNENFECGNDSKWKSYKDEKCFRVIKSMATRDEALKACNEQNIKSEFSPSLLTINSEEEQKFMEDQLFNKMGVEDNVWIGGKRDKNDFVWNDGSYMEFSNWAENKPTNDSDKDCIQMQSIYSSIRGKWIDTSCDRQSLVVCEKMQIWSFPSLQKAFLRSRGNFAKIYEDMEKKLEIRDKRIITLEQELKKLDLKILNFISENRNIESRLMSTINDTYEILFKVNQDILEQLGIKNTQIISILKDIDHLKNNSSNPDNNQIQSLRTELLALIYSKINESCVTDVRLEIVNHRRTLQCFKYEKWISVGYV